MRTEVQEGNTRYAAVVFYVFGPSVLSLKFIGVILSMNAEPESVPGP